MYPVQDADPALDLPICPPSAKRRRTVTPDHSTPLQRSAWQSLERAASNAQAALAGRMAALAQREVACSTREAMCRHLEAQLSGRVALVDAQTELLTAAATGSNPPPGAAARADAALQQLAMLQQLQCLPAGGPQTPLALQDGLAADSLNSSNLIAAKAETLWALQRQGHAAAPAAIQAPATAAAPSAAAQQHQQQPVLEHDKPAAQPRAVQPSVSEHSNVSHATAVGSQQQLKQQPGDNSHSSSEPPPAAAQILHSSGCNGAAGGDGTAQQQQTPATAATAVQPVVSQPPALSGGPAALTAAQQGPTGSDQQSPPPLPRSPFNDIVASWASPAVSGAATAAAALPCLPLANRQLLDSLALPNLLAAAHFACSGAPLLHVGGPPPHAAFQSSLASTAPVGAAAVPLPWQNSASWSGGVSATSSERLRAIRQMHSATGSGHSGGSGSSGTVLGGGKPAAAASDAVPTISGCPSGARSTSTVAGSWPFDAARAADSDGFGVGFCAPVFGHAGSLALPLPPNPAWASQPFARRHLAPGASGPTNLQRADSGVRIQVKKAVPHLSISSGGRSGSGSLASPQHAGSGRSPGTAVITAAADAAAAQKRQPDAGRPDTELRIGSSPHPTHAPTFAEQPAHLRNPSDSSSSDQVPERQLDRLAALASASRPAAPDGYSAADSTKANSLSAPSVGSNPLSASAAATIAAAAAAARGGAILVTDGKGGSLRRNSHPPPPFWQPNRKQEAAAEAAQLPTPLADCLLSSGGGGPPAPAAHQRAGAGGQVGGGGDAEQLPLAFSKTLDYKSCDHILCLTKDMARHLLPPAPHTCFAAGSSCQMQVEVVDPAGEAWPMTYRSVPARYSYEFRAGWKALAANWGVSAGDTITLRRLGSDRYRLHIEITHGEPGSGSSHGCKGSKHHGKVGAGKLSAAAQRPAGHDAAAAVSVSAAGSEAAAVPAAAAAAARPGQMKPAHRGKQPAALAPLLAAVQQAAVAEMMDP